MGNGCTTLNTMFPFEDASVESVTQIKSLNNLNLTIQATIRRSIGTLSVNGIPSHLQNSPTQNGCFFRGGSEELLYMSEYDKETLPQCWAGIIHKNANIFVNVWDRVIKESPDLAIFFTNCEDDLSPQMISEQARLILTFVNRQVSLIGSNNEMSPVVAAAENLGKRHAHLLAPSRMKTKFSHPQRPLNDAAQSNLNYRPLRESDWERFGRVLLEELVKCLGQVNDVEKRDYDYLTLQNFFLPLLNTVKEAYEMETYKMQEINLRLEEYEGI